MIWKTFSIFLYFVERQHYFATSAATSHKGALSTRAAESHALHWSWDSRSRLTSHALTTQHLRILSLKFISRLKSNGWESICDLFLEPERSHSWLISNACRGTVRQGPCVVDSKTNDIESSVGNSLNPGHSQGNSQSYILKSKKQRWNVQ